MIMKHFIKAILVILCLVPVIWFVGRPGILINGSDTNFPLDPIGWFNRRMYVWNATSNAGVDFSASTAGSVFHLVQVLPTLLAQPLQTTEMLSLIFWFSAILLAAYFLAKTLFPNNPILQTLFASLYAINPYMFNTWENAKVSNISFVLSLPIFLNIIISLNQNRISLAKGILLSTLSGLLISGAGINPAYFIIFSVFFWLSSAFYLKSIHKSVLVFLIILLVNAFWILPTTNFVLTNIGPFGGLDKIGYTNWIDSLSKNTSFYNVLRLQGAWDWYEFDVPGKPTYIPYAVNYFYRFPFIAFSLVLPFFSFMAYIFHEKKNRINLLLSGTLLIIGLFMASGTHPPTGVIFRRLLMNHLPFFSLFRSPWYIFTPLIILAYAILTGIFIDKLKSKFNKISRVLISSLFLGNLIYCYPLITGRIFRPSMPDNFYIRFPSYVFEAQKWLKSIENNQLGRILSYPPDEIERFKWGYNGIDSILSLLSSVEVVFSPLNGTATPTSSILKELYYRLASGDLELAENLANKLNTVAIFEKNDQRTLYPALPSAINKNEVKVFDRWSFITIAKNKEVKPKIFSPKTIYFGYPFISGEKMLAYLGGDDVYLNPEDSVIGEIPTLYKDSAKIVLAENSQVRDLVDYERAKAGLEIKLVDRNLNKVNYKFVIEEDGEYEPILEKSKLDRYKISYSAMIDSQDINLEVQKSSASYLFFQSLMLKKGWHNLTLDVQSKNAIEGGDFDLGEKFNRVNEASYMIQNENGNRYLEIVNKDKTAPDPAAAFQLVDFDSSLPYLIKAKYKKIYGGNAKFEVTQSNKLTALIYQKEDLPELPEWTNYSFYFRPIFTDSIVNINLTAPFVSNGFGTKVVYDDLEAYPLFTNNLLLVKKAQKEHLQPTIKFTKVSPVLYDVAVSGATGPHTIVFSENYSPNWQFQSQDINQPAHFTANMYANAWFIETSPNDYKFRLYYKPQTWRYLGLVISIITLCAAISYFIYEKHIQKS